MGSGVTVKVDGIDVLKKALEYGERNVDKIIGRALFEEAQLVMRDSQREVPVKDGFLKASGTVEEPRVGRVITVTLGYGGAAAKYAIYVHNSPYEKNWTKAGTKSHFLTDPLMAAVPRIERGLTVRIGKILGRG